MHRNHELIDPHYATVSDAEDSDEMYAAIAELPPLYGAGAGSDTYAKINDRLVPIAAASNGNSNGSSSPTSPIATPNVMLETDGELSPNVPPTPPSVVSLKQLSVGSSRLNGTLVHSTNSYFHENVIKIN